MFNDSNLQDCEIDLHQTFQREPEPADFDRLVFYAAHVRSIQQSTNYAYGEYRRTWEILSVYAPQLLFPKLLSLICSFKSARAPASMLCLGPRLRCAALWYPDERCDDTVFEEFVVALSQKCTGLERLSIEDSGSETYSPCGYIPRLGYLSHLTVFRAQYLAIGPDALMTLSTLPCLSTLKMSIQPSDYEDWDVLPHHRTSKSFHTLTTLGIISCSLEWIVAFLNIVTTPKLQDVWIEVADTSDTGRDLPFVHPQLLWAFCAALSIHPSSSSIYNIHLSIDGERPPPDNANFDSCEQPCPPNFNEFEVYRDRHLAPLLQLSSLRTLYIHSWCGVYPTDAFLARASRSWPHIGALVFKWITVSVPDDREQSYAVVPGRTYTRYVPAYPWFHPPTATLAGLIPLAQGCKSLRHVCVYIDAVNMPEDDPASPVGRALRERPALAESPAWCFDFEMSPIGNPVRVAAFLSGLFPQMEIMDAHPASQWEPQWREANSLNRKFKKVREQERRARWGRNGLPGEP